MLSLGVGILGDRIDQIMQGVNVALEIIDVSRIINRDQIVTAEFLRQILEVVSLADYAAPFTRCIKIIFVLLNRPYLAPGRISPADRESLNP